jgi:hypothetical protein
MRTQNENTKKSMKLRLDKKTVFKLRSTNPNMPNKDRLNENNFILTLDCGGDSYYKRCMTIIN